MSPSDRSRTYRVRVRRIVQETADALSLVFDISTDVVAAFCYRAGQYITLKIPYEGRDLVRAYSLASSPDCDVELKVTIKRVPQGRVSNWIHDNVQEGDILQVLPPAGLFTLNAGRRPLKFFAAGSGITPVISLIKSALVTSDRTMTLVYANRDEAGIIFRRELEMLGGEHSPRFVLHHHLDSESGLFGERDAAARVALRDDAEFYICGPTLFMDAVENVVARSGVGPERVHTERFVSPSDGAAIVDATSASQPASGEARVEVRLDGRSATVVCEPGETILAGVQRAGLQPPFSCTEGFCGCCMARLRFGRVRMKRNDFLSARELDEGWVLTCQAVPLTPSCGVDYPD